jgi:hypothetical protein
MYLFTRLSIGLGENGRTLVVRSVSAIASY